MSLAMRWAMVAFLSGVLAACGGSGGSSSESSSSVNQTSSSGAESSSSAASSETSSASTSSAAPDTGFTGVFVDSAVAGIGYRTSPSGREGVTNSEGEYRFDEGDSVVFFIGELELPSVAAKGIVTPLDIAGSDDVSSAVVVNIARLLQSLDADGDPSNGIAIPSGAAAVATAVNFSLSVEDFAASPAVVNLVANSGSSTTTLISAEAATAHLQASVDEQRQSLIGSWYYQDVTDPDVDRQYHIVLTFLDDQRFILLNDEDETEDDGGMDGFESGTYTWNLRTGVADFVVEVDTNGEWGTSHPCHEDEVIVLEPRGDTLYLHVEGGVGESCDEAGGEVERIAFQRVKSATDPLVGSWFIEQDGDFMLVTLTADGFYMTVENDVNIDDEHDETGQPGIERGTYTYDAETKVVLFVTQTDTNGQWGFSHSCAVADLVDTNNLACGPDGRDIVETFTVEGDTLIFVSEIDTIVEDEVQPVVFTRVGAVAEPVDPGTVNLSGTWLVSVVEDATGSCEETELYYYDDVYTVVQDGDALTVSEPYGTYQGSVDGLNLTWSGPYVDQNGSGTTSVTATFDVSGDVMTLSGSSSWTFDDGDGFSCTGTSTFTGQLQ